MNDYTTYVGMDVHARSITAKAWNSKTDKRKLKHFGGEDYFAKFIDWLFSLAQPVYCAYESGCTGAWMARELCAAGFTCEVLAVSTLEHSDKDRKQKCDKKDAEGVLSAITNPNSKHTAVFTPDEAQEGERDFNRLVIKAKDDLKSRKQELSSFLMRKGYVWNEKTKTGRLKAAKGAAWEKWLNSITFKDFWTQTTFMEMRRRVKEAQDEHARLKAMLHDMAQSAEHKLITESLRCIKGIDETTAMTVVAEICDFERFSGGRKVTAWCGLAPKDNSSGEKERHGSITLAGDKYIRRTLVEAVSSVACWSSPYKQPPKDAEVPPSILALAKKANKRIYDRYHHLKDDLKKNSNVAKVAIAGELVRWCWVIGREASRLSKAG